MIGFARKIMVIGCRAFGHSWEYLRLNPKRRLSFPVSDNLQGFDAVCSDCGKAHQDSGYYEGKESLRIVAYYEEKSGLYTTKKFVLEDGDVFSIPESAMVKLT